MAALTKPRQITRYGNKLRLLNLPIAAATKIWAGAIVCKNTAGYAVPGAATNTLIVLGIASETVDNTAGANGALRVPIEECVADCANLGADPVSFVDVGKLVYLADDQSIAKTDDTGARPPAGVLKHFEIVPFVDLGARHTGDS